MESFLSLSPLRCLGRGDKAEREKNGCSLDGAGRGSQTEVSGNSLNVLSPALMDKCVGTTFSCFCAVTEQENCPHNFRKRSDFNTFSIPRPAAATLPALQRVKQVEIKWASAEM